MGRLFAPKKPEPPKEPEKAPTPPPPAGVSKEDVERIVSGALTGVGQQLAESQRALGERIEALASRQPQVVVQPAQVQPAAVADLDAEIDSAVLSGQGAASRIKALVDREVNKAAERLVREHIEPLQQYGVNTIGELSRRITAGGMKHYVKYQKEIDQRLNALSPEVRANPAVIEMVYNSVVGLHADELAREAAEAAVRQAQEPQNDPPPVPGRKAGSSATPGSGAAPGAPREDEVPTAEQVGGALGMEALAHKGSGGQSADEFARTMGYKDWADYQKQYKELLAAESQGNA